MPFWNPLISGKRVLEIEFNEPATGQAAINLATYVTNNNPSGSPNDSYDEIRVTIPSNYIIGSPSPGTAALTVGSWQPYQDVTLINNGYIVGRGGSASGGAGGPAINVNSTSIGTFTIENNSGAIIAGGGGGGNNGSPTPGSVVTVVPGGPDPDGGSFPPYSICSPATAAGGAGGGGAGFFVGNPNASLTPAPVAGTPSASFPIPSVSFNSGSGAAGQTLVGCSDPLDIDGDPTGAVSGPPFSGTPGTPGGPLGTGGPGRGGAGAYLSGPGVPKTTIINNGSLYGPSPYGNQPGQ